MPAVICLQPALYLQGHHGRNFLGPCHRKIRPPAARYVVEKNHIPQPACAAGYLFFSAVMVQAVQNSPVYQLRLLVIVYPIALADLLYISQCQIYYPLRISFRIDCGQKAAADFIQLLLLPLLRIPDAGQKNSVHFFPVCVFLYGHLDSVQQLIKDARPFLFIELPQTVVYLSTESYIVMVPVICGGQQYIADQELDKYQPHDKIGRKAVFADQYICHPRRSGKHAYEGIHQTFAYLAVGEQLSSANPVHRLLQPIRKTEPSGHDHTHHGQQDAGIASEGIVQKSVIDSPGMSQLYEAGHQPGKAPSGVAVIFLIHLNGR